MRIVSEMKLIKMKTKTKNFMFGKKCIKCKKGRMSLFNFSNVECSDCGYKEKRSIRFRKCLSKYY